MFLQPKIFLIDTDERIHKELQKNWATINTGTLGRAYKVPSSSSWRAVIQNKALSKFEESDVIIVDLALNNLLDNPKGEKHTPDGEVDLWAKCDKGWIDARARTALSAKEDFNRIVKNGGAVIIFAGPDSPMQFQWATADSRGLNGRAHVPGGVWNLVDPIDRVNIFAESGSVINVTDNSPIGSLLKRHLDGAEFTCTFKNKWSNDETWLALATNKYDSNVASIAKYGDGLIMIFPQLSDKASFICELLSDILPEILPELFPDIEKGKWTHSPEYELETIKLLEAKKAIVIAETEKELEKIEQEIFAHRAENGWIQDLISETGDNLVNAIKIALSDIGFEQVVDVDEIRDAEGKSRREDLRIEDHETTLIIDIKGVGGKASDDDLMQANKHAMINMKELKKTTIQGLSIINQQRHLPPLKRDNNEPFRKEILDFAEETGLGLMTTFDLYRLVLNKQKHSWPTKCVKPLLYEKQRIKITPTHYQYIGTVSKVFSEFFGMHILQNSIKIGDRLAIEGDIYFEEIEVNSLQVNNSDVQSATVGDPAGFKWPMTAMKLKPGMRVYAVPRDFETLISA